MNYHTWNYSYCSVKIEWNRTSSERMNYRIAKVLGEIRVYSIEL